MPNDQGLGCAAHLGCANLRYHIHIVLVVKLLHDTVSGERCFSGRKASSVVDSSVEMFDSIKKV
jgi:hypothetical protein